MECPVGNLSQNAAVCAYSRLATPRHVRARDLPGDRPDCPQTANCGIVVLSADSDVLDKVLLLEMGARDYITKPFSPRELLARLRTALRCSAPLNIADIFVFGDV